MPEVRFVHWPDASVHYSPSTVVEVYFTAARVHQIWRDRCRQAATRSADTERKATEFTASAATVMAGFER